MVFSMFLTCCAPLYKIFFTDEYEMIIPVVLPFIDPETKYGFYINLGNQLVSCAYGLIIIPGTELMTCVLKNTISVTAAVIQNSLLEFDNLVQQNEAFSMEYAQGFQNIILKILDFDKFVYRDIAMNY